MKILVIDDDKMTRRVVEKEMRKLKHEVESAGDAFEGLAMLEKDKFDLVISDIMMPTISGLSLVSVVKEFVSRKVPVVIMSSLHDEDIVDTCARLGAVEFLPKPIDFRKLSSICNRYK